MEEDSSTLTLGPGAHARQACVGHARPSPPLAGSEGERVIPSLSSVCATTPDFARAKCLMNADVALILEHKRAIMQGKGIQPKSDFLKAYQYVNAVKQFRDREVVNQVRK